MSSAIFQYYKDCHDVYYTGDFRLFEKRTHKALEKARSGNILLEYLLLEVAKGNIFPSILENLRNKLKGQFLKLNTSEQFSIKTMFLELLR